MNRRSARVAQRDVDAALVDEKLKVGYHYKFQLREANAEDKTTERFLACELKRVEGPATKAADVEAKGKGKKGKGN